jgi:hypothetical protein
MYLRLEAGRAEVAQARAELQAARDEVQKYRGEMVEGFPIWNSGNSLVNSGRVLSMRPRNRDATATGNSTSMSRLEAAALAAAWQHWMPEARAARSEI